MNYLKKQSQVRTSTITLLLILLVLIFSRKVDAQETTARIVGSVTDSTKAVIPGVKVTLTEKFKNQIVYSGNADGTGHFLIPQVPPGEYVLTADAKGFSEGVLTDITATLGQTITLAVVLKPGSSDVSVSVNASTQELLEKATSDVSTLITPSEVEDLPMPNRDITTLLEIVPGASYGGDSTSPATYQLSFNGGRTLGTDVMLDGISMIENVTGQILPLPSPDALGQLRFSTLNAPAEYGRTSGAVMSVVTKSGTNDFHYRLYELYRNAIFNANSYFNNLNAIARPPGTYNQYGVVITGPVVIPKLYNGRNKTFFMVNFDQTPHIVATTVFQTIVPTAFRTGDFSSLLTQTNPIIIDDPLTKSPFPGNIIPMSRLDPAAVAIMGLLPAPTGTGVGNVGGVTSYNYVVPQTYKSDGARYALRVDEAIGQRDRFYGMGERFFDPKPQPVLFNALLNPNPGFSRGNGWVASIGETHTWNSNVVSDIRYGYQISYFNNQVTGTASSLSAMESLLHIATLPLNAVPSFQIYGYNNIGAEGGLAGNYTNFSNSLTYYLAPQITIVHGRNAIKTGASYRWNLYNNFTPGAYPNGEYSFEGDVTSPSQSEIAGPNAAADFMLGAVKTSQYEIPAPPAGRRNQNVAAFIQDDWRATSKLTMNIGVRYEYETPIYFNNNNFSRVDSTNGSLLVAGLNANKYLNVKTPHLDFMPRVGFAYAPTSKLVIRGAFGTFYAGIMGDLDGGNNFLGFDNTLSTSNQGTGKPQPYALSQGMPLTINVNLKDPFQAMQNASATNPVGSGELFYLADLTVLPVTQERNLGIQYQLPGSTVLVMNYVGSHGLHLPYYISSNIPALSQATAVAYANNYVTTQNAAPISFINTDVYWNYFVADSNFNSLQVTVRKQYSKRLSFTGNLTWAHEIDDQSGSFNFATPNGSTSGQYPADPILRRMDRSSGAFDVRTNLNVTVQLASVSRYRLLDGWKLAPVIIARSGLPLNITQTTEFPGAQTQRPLGTTKGLVTKRQVVGSPGAHTIQAWQSPTSATFPLTPSGPIFTNINNVRTQIVPTVLGDIGRYAMRSDGEFNINASLSRSFQLPKRSILQLRLDAFNVTNHTNFTSPAAGLTVQINGLANSAAQVAAFQGNNFGQITSTYSPRFMQLQANFTY